MNPLPTVAGGWPCVLADPPWSFRDKGSRIAPERAPGGRYDTMRLGDICTLPVRQVVAPDALLFLWTTSAHLLDGSAAKVCEAWGFAPKTTAVWVKRSPAGKLTIGMGHYTRAAHEMLVVARRGRARVLARNVPSVFFAPRTRHSAKPDESYRLVESLAAGPRLELFARRAREGWSAWGNEAPAPGAGARG